MVRRRLIGGERELDDKFGRADLVDVDCASVTLDDVADDGETQSGAAGVTRPPFVEPGEAFEDALAIFGGDTVTVVAYRELRPAVQFGERDYDCGGRVALGVLDQVAGRPGELIRIADRLDCADPTKVDGDATAFVETSGLSKYDVVEVDTSPTDLGRCAIDAGEVEQVIDEVLQGDGFFEDALLCGRGVVRLWASDVDFEFGAYSGERAAQLV